MKTIVKKSGIIAALTVIFVLTTALVTNCPAPISSNMDGFINPQAPAPAGQSYIRLSLDDSISRTVFPIAHTGTWFYRIDLIDETDGTTSLVNQQVDSTAGSTYTLAVTPGQEYSIVVQGFTTAAARTTGTAPTISGDAEITNLGAGAQAGVNNVSVVMAAAVNAGTGFFTYAFDLSAVAAGTTATLTIADLGGNASTPATATYNLTPNQGASGTNNSSSGTGIALNAGYYTMTVTMSQTGFQSVSIPEVVHIYPDLTSNYARPFNALNRNLYNITYHNDNGTVNLTSSGGVYATGNTIGHGLTIAAGPVVTGVEPTSVLNPGGTFTGWTRIQGTTSTQAPDRTPYDFGGTDPVYRDINLYALFAAAANNAAISVSYTPDGTNFSFTFVPTTLVFDFINGEGLTLNGTDLVTNLELTIGSPGTFTGGITWDFTGTTSPMPTVPGGTSTGTISIDLTDDAYWAAGTYEFYIEGIITDTPDNRTYSGKFEFTVNP